MGGGSSLIGILIRPLRVRRDEYVNPLLSI
jgi:hypothetical protein